VIRSGFSLCPAGHKKGQERIPANQSSFGVLPKDHLHKRHPIKGGNAPFLPKLRRGGKKKASYGSSKQTAKKGLGGKTKLGENFEGSGTGPIGGSRRGRKKALRRRGYFCLSGGAAFGLLAVPGKTKKNTRVLVWPNKGLCRREGLRVGSRRGSRRESCLAGGTWP